MMMRAAAAAALLAAFVLIPAYAAPALEQRPPATAAVENDEGTIAYLGSPEDVDLVLSGTDVYALVVDAGDNAVSAFDITDPDQPKHLWSKYHSLEESANTYGLLNAQDVDVVDIGAKKYAVITSSGLDHGVPSQTDPLRVVPPAFYTTDNGRLDGYTGGLQIIDITDMSAPAFVSYVNQGSEDGGGDKFDYLAGAGSSAIFELNGKTYVATGSDAGDRFYGGLQITDISDPTSPEYVSHVRTGDPGFGTEPEHSNLEGGANKVDVVLVNGVPYALMTADAKSTPGSSTMTGSLTVISLADPAAPAHASTIKAGGAFDVMYRPSDVTAAAVGGKPYAIVSASTGAAGFDPNRSSGLQVIDLSDPGSPVAASSMIDGRGFDALAVADGMHVADIGSKTYLFAPSSFDNTMSIIDFDDPSAPVQVSTLANEAADAVGARPVNLIGASGADTVSVGDKTYAMVTASGSESAQVFDVTDPSRPVERGLILDGTLGFAALEQPFHVEAVKVGPRSYLAVTDWARFGVQLIDVTNPAAPQAVSNAFGKFNNLPPIVAGPGERNLAEGLKKPRGLDSFTQTVDGAERTYLIVAADYSDPGAFVIFDMTDPSELTHVYTGYDKHPQLAPESEFDALKGAADVAVYEAGGTTYAIITGRTEPGVQIVDLTDPRSPAHVNSAKHGENDSQRPTPVKFNLDKPYGVDIFDVSGSTYAAVAGIGSDGVQIIQVDDPDNLKATAFVADTDATNAGSNIQCSVCLAKANQVSAVTIDVSGTATPHLIVASKGERGVQIINVSNPTSPALGVGIADRFNPGWHPDSGVLHTSFSYLSQPYGVETFTIGSTAYAAVTGNPENGGGVQIIGLADPAGPVPAAVASTHSSTVYPELQGARGIAAFDVGSYTYAAVAGFDDEGVQIMRLGGESDSTAPAFQSAVLTDGEVLEITFDDLIDVSDVDLDKLAISEPGRSNENVLIGAALETDSDDITLRIRLTSAQAAAVKSITSPELDIEAGAVKTSASQSSDPQAIGISHDNAITPDSTAPAYRGAVLDLSSGVLIMTFDSPMDPGSADLSKMRLHDGGPKHALIGSSSVNSLNRAWVALRLGEEMRQAMIVLSSSTSSDASPIKLDFEAGALSGSSGADVEATENAAVRVLRDDRHPRLEYAELTGGALSMTFDETIDVSRANAARMTLVVGSSTLTLSGSEVTSAADSPTLELRLDQATVAGIGGTAGARSLDLDYEAVWDTSGNHLLRETGHALGEPPRLVSAEATSTDSVTVRLSKPVTGTGQLHSAWSLQGSDAAGLSVSSAALDGDSVALRLSGDFPNTAPDVDVMYTFGRVSLTDADGLELADGRVTVSDKIAPGLLAARASSLTSVEVEFTEVVSPGRTDGTGWTVSGPDSAGRTVSAVQFSQPAESARLTLSGPLADTSPSLSLSYAPSGGIQDLSSNPMPAGSLDSVEDRIAPEFVSASLQGSRSFLVTYSEDVESAPSHYAQISSGTSTVRAESVVGSPGSSILVVIDPSSATFSAGAPISFTILPAVADLAGNTLSNAGPVTIPASETAGVARLVLANPGNDGRSELPLTDDTLVRTVVVQRGTAVDLDVSSLTDASRAAHPRVSGAEGGTAVFSSDLAVRVASGTVTFQSGLQVGGLNADAELIRVGTAPSTALPAEFASAVRLDAARAATVLELGDPARTLSFSEPVRIDLAEPLSEIAYVIRADGARQVLSCGTQVGTPAQAESAIAALARSATADADSCYSDERTIWTFSFSLWGSGPALAPEPEPEPEPEPAETIRRGGGGGGGGGSLRGPASAGPSDSVYVATVSWDCSASLVTVTAGPDSDGLSVSVISSVLGSMQAEEDTSARSGGLRTFTAPMSANEDFLQVTAMHISARDFVQDRRSVNLDQCQGSQTFWTPPRASGQQGTAAQTEPDPEPETMPAPQTERQDREPVAQCPAGTVMRADGECSAPEAQPLTSEPGDREPPVECGPGTQMGADGTCVVVQAETGDQNGCLVATAAYGTELAPAVQKVREIRDGALLQTGAGSAFMSAFNSAYYAFSPAVADLERQNPAFRDAVRAGIAPMIYSLQIMDAAESEAQVAAYGLAVIALNLAMYGGAPAAAVYAGLALRRRA